MSSALHATLDSLKKAATDEAVLLFYSGGKDSLVVADLCCRAFKRVVGVFMELIPGLECVEQQLDYGRRRWGFEIMKFPHWLTTKFLVEGVYCNNSYKYDDLAMSLSDVYAAARVKTGIKLIATGAKKADSQWRRRNLATSSSEGMLYPIVEWNKFDVLAYLRKQDIEIPVSSGASATGIDLSTPSLLWLHDTFPDDFKRLCRYFPYAEAVPKRREFYGIGDYYGQQQPADAA